MVEVSRSRFEELAAEALDSLPPWVLARMDNVEIVTEATTPPGEPGLLGLYRGVPLTKRGMGYSGVLPDTITLYRSTIMAAAHDEEQLRRVVAHTVAHEIAHHFGISDDRLREMGAY